MNDREALEYYKNIFFSSNDKDATLKAKNAKELAINALEKQVPQNVVQCFTVIHGRPFETIECPKCEYRLPGETNFCDNCGQKLDWSELE